MKKLTSIVTLFIYLTTSAQTFTPEEALQKFAKYPQERIFVQFDKPDYLAGETMHFKAYVFSKFTLSRISTNLYFEYLDKNKKVIYKNTAPLYSGIAQGSFTFPKKLTEDVYYFRAYTSWMLNFDEKFQFIKPVNIYNPYSPTKLVERPDDWAVTIHPEGGTLLDNVDAKTVVRLHSAGTLPKKFSGYLFENADTAKKILSIDFLNSELGSFTFMPAYGKNYGIRINDNKGVSRTISLPAIMQSGVSLAISNSPSGIIFNINARGIPDGLKGYKIVAHNEGDLIFSALIKNNVNTVSSTIPPDSLTKGLVHISLFDTKGKAVAERLCFAPPAIVSLAPQIEFGKRSSQQKGLNEWSIDVDSITTYTYTIEIANAGEVADESQNFLTSFWLGDLLLRSHETNDYFNNTAVSANGLDYLLISEKWKRFEWSKFLDTPVAKLKYVPDNFLTYQGVVTQNRNLIKNEKIAIVMQMPDSARIFVGVNTDNAGRFTVKNLEFRDTAKAFFRINNIQKSPTVIDIAFTRLDDSKPYSDSLPSTAFTTAERKANDPVPEKIKDYSNALNNITNDDGYKKLEGVIVKAKARSVKDALNKELSSPQFRDVNEVVFDFINENNDDASGGIIDWLNGKVAGLTVDGGTASMRGQDVKIYLNEFSADYDQLNAIPVTEIAMIKVLRTPFMLGSGAPVIAVYTKTASMFKAQALSLKSAKIIGYPTIEKFKTIDYSELKLNPGERDTRSVLYWNTILTPEKNKQPVKFYNNDVSKQIHLVIIGFRKNGTPVYLDKDIAL